MTYSSVLAAGSERAATSSIDFQNLVARIQQNDAEAMADLYAVICRSIRLVFFRHVHRDAEDLTHELFLDLVQAIKRDKVHNPQALLGFARTAARFKLARAINASIERRKLADTDLIGPQITDHRPTPDEVYEDKATVQWARRALSALSERDREILERFYFAQESPQQIQDEMHLTPTQYRLFKSRAKAKFTMVARASCTNGARPSRHEEVCAAPRTSGLLQAAS